MNAVGALREDEALGALRQRVQVPARTQACNPYLLRFVRASELNVDEAHHKLTTRRAFEEDMSTIFPSAHTLTALQSGSFAILGADVFHRPILYIRLRDFAYSGESTGETRLAIMILEYLLTLVEVNRGAEQCLIVVNERDAGFWAGRDGPVQERLSAVVQKYYPGLIRAILVVNSSWQTKRILRLQAATGSGSGELRELVQFVSSKDLLSLMTQEVIPTEFDGKNDVAATSPPEDFADRVLRHWYALTTALQPEKAAGGSGSRSRPLWQPVPRGPLAEAAAASTVAVQRRVATAGGAANTAADTGERMHTARGASSGLPPSVLGASPSGPTQQYSEDGRASINSEDLFSAQDDEWTHTDSRFGSAVSRIAPGSFDRPSGEEGEGGDDEQLVSGEDEAGGAEGLRDRLRIEVDRRRQLEKAVEQLRLGVAYRGTNTDRERPVEAALRKHHEHINTLTAQIVAQNRDVRPPRTLQELLDATDYAILGAIADQQTTPCMSGAVPVNRQPSSSCIVS